MGRGCDKSHMQDHRSKAFGGQGNGNNSLEADEAINERGIIRYATLDEYKADPGFANEGETHPRPTRATRSFPIGVQRGQRLGHVHRHEQFVGCNACIVSCYAENNIPVWASSR